MSKLPLTGAGPSAGGMAYSKKVLSYSPLVYFIMGEAAGGVSTEEVSGWDGAYTGVTLGETGIGDGNTCPLFDGLNDFNNIWTAGLSGAYDGAEITLAGWLKIYEAATWTDGTFRYAIRLYKDARNSLYIAKRSQNNQFRFGYEAANTGVNVALTGQSFTVWTHVALTASRSAGATGELKGYLAGSQVGSTQTGLGTWEPSALAGTLTTIGAGNTTPASPWHGWLAHWAIFDSALSDTVITDLATV